MTYYQIQTGIGDSLQDIAMREYGDLEGMFLILEDNTNLADDLNPDIVTGTVLNIRTGEDANYPVPNYPGLAFARKDKKYNLIQVTKTGTAVPDLGHSDLALLTDSQKQYILASLMSDQFIEDHVTMATRNKLSRIETLQTGQITSFFSNDDGSTRRGRLADFFTLKLNNQFGNTNRYTDEAGGQNYTNNYIIDHATGKGWYRVVQNYAAPYNLGSYIAQTTALSITIGSATFTDWYIPTKHDFFEIDNDENTGDHLYYSPFLLSGTTDYDNNLVTSTSYAANGTFFFHREGLYFKHDSTDITQGIICRKHYI